MAPVFSHGDLRLYLLNLLDEEPRHGYDLMQALADRTGGTYTPSAGTVYPRLAKLEEEGLLTKTTDGRKTVYEITDAGRREVESRAGEVEGIEAGLADSVRLIAEGVRVNVRAAMRSLQADLAAAARAERQASKNAPRDSSPSRPAPSSDRAASREQLQRADAALSSFRGDVRTDLRTYVARGGRLDAGVVDDLITAIDSAREALTRSLHTTTPQ